MHAEQVENDFLTGSLGPVREEVTVTDLEVEGELPDFLDGRYLRNGPNPVAEVDPATYTWFAGDGMVHGVRLRDGRAEWYRNRYVRAPHVATALGERPGGIPTRYGMPTIGANTNVIGHAGRTFALVEGGVANYELADDLSTIGPCNFDGTIPGGYTAHPMRDPQTGELHAISYFSGRGHTVQYSVIGTDGRAHTNVDIDVQGSPMIHGFAMTQKYAIVLDLPVTFDARQAAQLTMPRPLQLPARLVMSALIGRHRLPDPLGFRLGKLAPGNAGFPYTWDPRYAARVGLVDRQRPEAPVRWFEVDPCYVFHPFNAYDDGDTVVLDVVRHGKVFDEVLVGPTEGAPTLDRWVIDTRTGVVTETRIDDRMQEFPRVDPRLTGAAHRYGYSVALDPGFGATDTLLKYDLQTGRRETKSFGPGTEVGEFVFEPYAADAAEDAGVLMGYVYDRATDRSSLAVVDAGSLETIATVRIPARIPHGFHGNWVPQE